MRGITGGTFTIGHPELLTGKAHMVCVRCDLCGDEQFIDPGRYNTAGQGMINNGTLYGIMQQHVCTKPKKVVEKKKAKPPKKIFEEYEVGTRRRRMGPHGDSDDYV